MDRGQAAKLLDACLPLEPSHISNDLVGLCGAYPFDLRHVAELPVMGTHTILNRSVKRNIGVMVGFVNLMHQRRALDGSDALFSVAARAIGLELRFAGL